MPNSGQHFFFGAVCGFLVAVVVARVGDWQEKIKATLQACLKSEQTSQHTVAGSTGLGMTVVEEELLVLEGAPEDCPGVESEKAGKSSACDGCPNQNICASGEAAKPDPDLLTIQKHLENVSHKVLVVSGKGGVGKSTCATQLAFDLERRGFEVGLLDIDICGPSIAHMTACSDSDVHQSGDGWQPVYITPRLRVMSIALMLGEKDAAIIWRGPKKNGLIKQFLMDVPWGSLDILLVDTPPGTSDEHLSIVTYLQSAGIDGSIVVTTPQEVALLDVRREINFCKKSGLTVLGVVENMTNSIFQPSTGGAPAMCDYMGVAHWGGLTLDKNLAEAGEKGKSVRDLAPDSVAASEVSSVTDQLLTRLKLPFTRPDDSPATVSHS